MIAAPVRVARIIARTNVGGPSLQVTALMREIDRTRFEQVLYRGTVDEGEADYLELRAPDVGSVVVPGLGRSVRPLDDVRALLFLVRQLRAQRPTIVHTHTAKAGMLGRVAAVVARVPIRVHTFHGHVLHGYFSPLVTRAIVLAERLLRPATTYAVAVGEQVRDDLVRARIVRDDRSVVVAPGVRKPEHVDASAARADLGLGPDDVVVVFVGRLTAIKRGERFVELAREIARRHRDARFLVIGDGPLRAELERLGSDVPSLQFAGWRSDVQNVYAAADIVVLTSDNEGMPVALIEAAMQGVPAVATDVGAVRQVVADGESGVVVPVGDAEALVRAVDSLIAQPDLRRRYGAAAASRAEELFGESRLVADYTQLYERLLAESEARRGTVRGRRLRRP